MEVRSETCDSMIVDILAIISGSILAIISGNILAIISGSILAIISGDILAIISGNILAIISGGILAIRTWHTCDSYLEYLRFVPDILAICT